MVSEHPDDHKHFKRREIPWDARADMILDLLCVEFDDVEDEQEAKDVLLSHFRQIAEDQRERDANLAVEVGKSAKPGINNAAWEIAQAIRGQS